VFGLRELYVADAKKFATKFDKIPAGSIVHGGGGEERSRLFNPGM